MITVSQDYKDALAADNRNFYCKAVITFWNGDTLTVDNEDIWSGGFQIKQAVSGQNTFEIGACVIGEFKLMLNNFTGAFDGYDFTDAEIVASFGLYDSDGTLIDMDGNGATTIQKGVYFVDEVDTNSGLITLTCLDAMAKFDVDYSIVNQAFPATLAEIVENICIACEVPYTPAVFPNSTYNVWTAPSSESLTCRDVLSMVCEIACSYGRINTFGEFAIGFFNTDYMRTVVPEDDALDGGSFWVSVDSADGGSFWNFNVPVHDSGTMVQDTTADYGLSGFFKFSRGNEDIRIYGVYVTSDSLSYLSGSDKNAVEISGNLLINPGDEGDMALDLSDKLRYCGFRPFDADHLADPTLEAGETLEITDHLGNVYHSILMKTEFSAGERQQSECSYTTNASQRFRSISNARITGSTFTNGNGDFNVDREGNVTAKNINVADINAIKMSSTSLNTEDIVANTITGNILTINDLSKYGSSAIRILGVEPSYASYFGSQRWKIEWYDPDDSVGFQYYFLEMNKGKFVCYPQDAGSRRLLIDSQKGQIYSGTLEADGDITTYYGNYYVDNNPMVIKKGYTWDTGDRYIAGFTTTGSRDVTMFFSSSKPILASSVSLTSLSMTLRNSGNYPFARSGSSGGTYTQLGSGLVTVWSNGASARTNEVERVGLSICEDGVNIAVRFTYAPTTTNGGTTAMANNVPIGLLVRATFQFS